MLGAISRCRSVNLNIMSWRRSLLQAVNAQVLRHASTRQESVRSFEEIPEAKILPEEYDPERGFNSTRLFEIWCKRHGKLGDIYREKGGDQKDMVFCRSLADTEALFRLEGRYPNRIFMDGVQEMYGVMNLSTSIVNVSGEEWHKMRRPLNELLLKNKMIWKYAGWMQEIAAEFLECIERKKDSNGEVPNFPILMNKWAFENSGTFLFNKRLGMLRDEHRPVLDDMFQGMTMLLSYLGDRAYSIEVKRKKKLDHLLLVIRDEMRRLVEESKKISKDFEESVLAGLMSRAELSDSQKATLMLDLLLSAFETTARTAEIALYGVTLDPKVQDNLRKEYTSMPATATGRELDAMVYTNAYMKEIHRLYPFSHLMSRTFDHDIVLSGYRIPAGTKITNTVNSTQNRNPDIFPDPNKFSPERWLDRQNQIVKFSTTGPFGFGGRACPGRRFAMQEIHILLKAVLSRYRVEYNHEPMISSFRLTGTLSAEPRFTFHSL